MTHGIHKDYQICSEENTTLIIMCIVHEVTFVTELLTLNAGTLSSFFFNILDKLAIPVVVSSESPRIPINSNNNDVIQVYM